MVRLFALLLLPLSALAAEVINDAFDGAAGNISGRLPAPVNDGTLWFGDTGWETSGTGELLYDRSAANRDAVIAYDTTLSCSDDTRVCFEANSGGPLLDNRITIWLRDNSVGSDSSASDGYGVNIRAAVDEAALQRRNAGSNTTLTTVFPALDPGTTTTYCLIVTGTNPVNIRFTVDGNEELNFNDSDAARIDCVGDGGAQARLQSNSTETADGVYDNFIVDDLAAPSGPSALPPTHLIIE